MADLGDKRHLKNPPNDVLDGLNASKGKLSTTHNINSGSKFISIPITIRLPTD